MTTMNTEPGEREYPDPKKSKAGRKGGLKQQENWRKGVKECDACGKLSADLNEHPCFIAAHNAATRMRERCVSVVRVWASEHKHAFVGHVIDKLYEELERDDVQQAD